MKKSAKKRGERRRRLYLVLIFLITIAAALTVAAFAYQKMTEPSEDEIAARISKFDLPEGRSWITKIENAEEQARLYPVLFSGTKNGQYALRYETLFAVYDYQEDKIIKSIPIIRINISQ